MYVSKQTYQMALNPNRNMQNAKCTCRGQIRLYKSLYNRISKEVNPLHVEVSSSLLTTNLGGFFIMKKQRSSLLFQTQPLVVNPELAQLIGLHEAIILQQLHYWIDINEKANKNYHEGKYWTYNTVEQWHEQFPYISYDTVKRTLTKLRKSNIVLTGNFNKSAYDKTLWYTINYEELNKLEDDIQKLQEEKEKKRLERLSTKKEENTLKPLKTLIGAICPNRSGQDAPIGQGNLPQPIPEITTETKKENIYLSDDNKTTTNLNDDGLMDGLNSKVEELEAMGYENMESIKGALGSLWKYGVSGQALQMVRKHFNLINYETIDTALYRFEEEYNKKKIKHPVKYLAACIYNAIAETDIHSFTQA